MHLKYGFERHREFSMKNEQKKNASSLDDKIDRVCPLRSQIAACTATINDYLCILPLGERKVILDFL